MVEWYVRNDNKIYEAIMGGNWNGYYTAPSGIYKYMSDKPDAGYSYAVRNNGGISRIYTVMVPVKNISFFDTG